MNTLIEKYQFITVICFLVAVLAACSKDPVEAEPDEERIVIDQTPGVLVGAGWTLDGPHQEHGSGDTILTEMPIGEYAMTWKVVNGYTKPDDDTLTLAQNGTITFKGAYVPIGFVLIEPGTFIMGSPLNEPGRYSNEDQHQVTLTKKLYMSKYEVTEEWWYQVMGGTPKWSQMPNYESWDKAIEFCNALSIHEGLTPAYTINSIGPIGIDGDVSWNRNANGYRLPTEAEWEYACRAGTVMAFNNDTNCLSSDTEANYNGTYPLTGCPTGIGGRGLMVVGSFPPNQWGLYDMHGNALEWVWDGYRIDYENLDPVDPVHDVGPGVERVLRGGLSFNMAMDCRSADRQTCRPCYPFDYSGWRPVRSAF